LHQLLHLGAAQALPGWRLLLLGRIDISHRERHQRCQASAVIDLPSTLVQGNQLDRRIEVMAVGIQLVQKIGEVVRR
jgi:hypothetical protein